MFSLERTYLGLVLNPLQKLFRRPGSSSQEFFASGCNLVDFSSSPTLRFPYGLEGAFLLPHVQQWLERSRAHVAFEPIPDLQLLLPSPPAPSLSLPLHSHFL